MCTKLIPTISNGADDDIGRNGALPCMWRLLSYKWTLMVDKMPNLFLHFWQLKFL